MHNILWILLLTAACSFSNPKIERSLAQIAGLEGFKDCSAENQEEYDRCHLTQKRMPYVLLHKGEHAKAALLIHGLTDGPFMMKDVAWELYRKGYNVIVPLMPGHGIEKNGVGDHDVLHHIKWQQWTAHLKVNVVPLLDEYGSEHIIVGGLSNGGILAVNTIANMTEKMRQRVKGMLLYSPLIGVFRLLTAEGSGLLVRAVMCTDLNRNSYVGDGSPNLGGGADFRYMMMPKNAVCQAQKLISHTNIPAQYKKFKNIPIFAVLSEDDNAIDHVALFDLMKNSDYLRSHMVIYSNKEPKDFKVSMSRAACTQQNGSDCTIITEAKKELRFYLLKPKDRWVDHAAVTLSHREENMQHVDPSKPEKILNYYYKFTNQKLNSFIGNLR